ncbi:reverse transcriptase domain-containing protein [Tanacetum coccineum]
MAKEDEKKQHSSLAREYSATQKMPFGLKNAGATYQRLVDKAFQKQIGRKLEVYVDDLVNTKGIKVCPDKVEAVLDLPSPKCLKDVQRLNGKLASLNKFLAKSAERSLPFLKTLKKCTKKSNFQWTGEAEAAFKQMKKLIAELPTLTAPVEKEELIIYLAAAREAVSAVLMTERETKQMPIYFVSRALQGPETYTPMEKLVLALVHASKRLKRYFQAHPIIIITDQPIKQVLSKPKIVGRLQKWSIKLGEYDIQYMLRTSVKGQILADFIVERSKDDPLAAPIEVEEEILDPWTDTYKSGRNIIHLHSEIQVNGSYIAKESDMIQYLEKVKTLISGFRKFSIKQVPRSENKKADALSKIASTSFAHLTKQVLVEELSEKSINEAKVFGLPREIISDNGKQFRDNPFKDWCEKLCIRQHFASVKHPQANGLVERANRSLGEGIKARLDKGSKDWIEEIPHVLWAYRTMIKSSNGDTPFSLTYGTDAVIPAKIGMPTLRTTEIDMIQNDEALKHNLDLLEERREKAVIREARSKEKMEKYYNSKVRNTSFNPGDLFTGTMKPAMQKTVESLALSGKDHTK